MREQRTYRVSFLIEKTVKVREGDEIQAELAAATHLTPEERRNAKRIKITYANGELVYDFATSELVYNFATIDKEWWARNALVKRPRKKKI